MTLAIVEVVILSRPYFSPEHLLIASINKQDVGFLHWLPLPESTGEGVVANIAIIGTGQQDQIAASLLEHACLQASRAGNRKLLFGQAPEHWTGYAGVGRYGMGGGIPEGDLRGTQWALAGHFHPRRRLESYRLDLTTYRATYDRELFAMRRTSKVERRRDVTDQPFRIAAAMSHMEMNRFIATTQSGQQIARAEVLLGDPEMMIVSGKAALLNRWEGLSARPSERDAAVRFVFSSMIAELIADRIEYIQATIEANRPDDARLLESVGFQLDQRGVIYTQSLPAGEPSA